jgi:alcohol dehydrogenase YqhD (iron-dependent ADH family)
MQGNFSYHNPTKLYFGDESLNYLKDELNNYGPVVLLNYGSGSVKRNGIYDQVVTILVAYGAYRLYDLPVREWLKKKWFK